ncbi:S8 family serine peptidase, partial [Candidatus Woesearchaeota archaeon]|nr:S8 family serine peptidase [Candidatus Woesearchaeota archaeon]
MELSMQNLTEVIVILKNEDFLNDKDFVNRQRFIKNSQKTILSNLSNRDIKDVNLFLLTNGFSAKITEQGYHDLIKNPLVSSIYLSKKEYVTLEESIPLINGDLSYNLGYTGKNQAVCVIDTGVDYTHLNMGSCSREEFESGACSKVIGGFDFWNNDFDPIDDFGHGTHVAGIVASNDSTFRGVAPDAKIVALKVCGATRQEGCNVPNMISAIDWCVNNATRLNISVITISIGGDKYEDFCNDDPRAQSINLAIENNILVTVSSGNDGYNDGINSPACIENATSVGATDKDDNVADYSNRHVDLDLLAPGGVWTYASSSPPYPEIVSTFSPNVRLDDSLCFLNFTINKVTNETECFDPDYQVNTDFIRSVGTSMAAPHVAGAAALLQDAYDGKLTPYQIQEALVQSGKQVWDPEVYISRFLFWETKGKFFPRIDVLAALDYISLLDVSHQDWPTFHHDNRRTGFTLLKGDIKNAKDVEQLDLVFQVDGDEGLASTNAVADIDNNDLIDTVMLGTYGTPQDPDSWLYVIESNEGYGNPLKRRVRGNIQIGDYSQGAPLLADTDHDEDKEIIVGLANGTLYLVDFQKNQYTGDLELSKKWSYTVPAKYSQRIGDTVRGSLGIGLIAADIDYDGQTEIIFTDELSVGIEDWPGEVFILRDQGNSYEFVDKYTFGNGGSMGGVSVANIDNDDNLEIIVSTYYGIKVFDFVNNKLQLKWQNSYGSFMGAPVLYDYDRDNQYEVLMTSSSLFCSAYKTCGDNFYVFDAAQGGMERLLALSFHAPTTLALANLDTDDHIEAATSFYYAEGSDLGGIACIDANDARLDCVYTNQGTFLNPGISPVIADIDGNGDNEIVIPENNKSILHVINGDGTQLFNYSFGGLIGSSPAIADIDDDGRAEIVVKRAGSPYSIMATLGSDNHQPYLEPMKPVIAIAGQTTSLSANASDPDNDTLTLYYSAPFNETGQWMPTNNDTGDYTILVEASDGNLSHHQYVPVKVLPEGTQVINVFADGSLNKTLVFTEAGQVQRVTIKI